MPICSPNCLTLVFNISSEIGIFCALTLVNHVNKGIPYQQNVHFGGVFLAVHFHCRNFQIDLMSKFNIPHIASMFQRVVKWFSNSCWPNFGYNIENSISPVFFRNPNLYAFSYQVFPLLNIDLKLTAVWK